MSVYAKVTVTLEIPVNFGWGNDCKMDQIFEQAREDASEAISRSVLMHATASGTTERGPLFGAKILDMKVTAVIVSE